MHALAPEEVVYLPAAHGVQLLDDEEEANDPAGHGLQVEAPVAAEYLPAGQSVHTLTPEEAVYLPAAHRGICASVAAFSAYTFPSLAPTKMLAPSGLTAGDDHTYSPVANAHLCAPVAAFSEYTFLSAEPTKMLAPSGLTAGDERTAFPVSNAHPNAHRCASGADADLGLGAASALPPGLAATEPPCARWRCRLWPEPRAPPSRVVSPPCAGPSWWDPGRMSARGDAAPGANAAACPTAATAARTHAMDVLRTMVWGWQSNRDPPR